MAKTATDRGPLKGFYQDTVDRIGAAVVYVESLPKESGGDRQSTATPRAGLYPAVLKSGANMAAGSLASPSSTVVSKLIPGTGDALVAGPDITILNYSSRTMTTAGKLLYYMFFNGKPQFFNGDC